MIHTITLNPFIEQRVRGATKDDILYEPQLKTYTSGGIGINVNKCLHAYHIDSEAHFIADSKTTSFIKEELHTLGINCTYLESKREHKIRNSYYDENEVCLNKEVEPCQIEDVHTTLLTSLILPNINEEDVVFLEYNETIVSTQAMQAMYTQLRQQCEVMICDLHPMYYSVLKQNQSNVLLLDAKTLQKQIGRKPLSEIITYIQEAISPLAKIVVYAISANDFLFFFEGSVQRVVCSVKQVSNYIHKEAIISGIIKCYIEDGDLRTLSEQCLSMSVGACLSGGLYAPSKEVITSLKTKMNMYTI